MRLSSLFPYFCAVVLLGASGAALAADTSPRMTAKPTAQAVRQDPLAAARAAIDKSDWPRAIELLKAQTTSNPRDADAFNLLGFSQRNAGDIPSALVSYEKALALDPNHKGAHEYLGETYLKLHDVPKAEAQRNRLQVLCPLGCEELDDLNKAIAAYKKSSGGP